MHSSVDTRTAAPAGGSRRVALTGYRWLLALFLLAGGAQIFLAGLGTFSCLLQSLLDGLADSASAFGRPARSGRAAHRGQRRDPVRGGPSPARRGAA